MPNYRIKIDKGVHLAEVPPLYHKVWFTDTKPPVVPENVDEFKVEIDKESNGTKRYNSVTGWIETFSYEPYDISYHSNNKATFEFTLDEERETGKEVFQAWLADEEGMDASYELSNRFNVMVDTAATGYTGSYTVTYDFEMDGEEAKNLDLNDEDSVRDWLDANYTDSYVIGDFANENYMEINDLEQSSGSSSWTEVEW